MSTDNRKFTRSICVRCDTKYTRIEASPAELHGGCIGLYRLRINRRWHDHPDGGLLFFDRDGIAELAADVAFGTLPPLPEAPDLPRGSIVSVKYWHRDRCHQEQTRTNTPPVRGYDGHYYVGVVTYHAGFLFVPAAEVELRAKPRQVIVGEEKSDD